MTSKPRAPSSPPASSASHSSRRRTPPLGRTLAQRGGPRPAPVLSTSPPPTFSAGFAGRSITGDVFCLDGLKHAVEEIERGQQKLGAGVKLKIDAKGKGKRKASWDDGDVAPETARRVTTIHDLPDELLLKVFSDLHDSSGFRSRPTPLGPQWYSPPVRLELVCRRWLPILRTLFYRDLSVNHPQRIDPLVRTLADPVISALVRRVSLNIAIPIPRAIRGHARTLSTEEGPDKSIKPTTQAQLRGLIQACPSLLRVEVAGIDPSTLFPESPTPSFSHLHRIRLVSITHLSLSASPGAPLQVSSLRAALLALTGLRVLTVKGFVSSPAAPLDLAQQTLTHSAQPIRQLPLRLVKLRLTRLAIIDSSFSAADLATLISHIAVGSLQSLTIEEIFAPVPAGEPPREPTLTALLLLPSPSPLFALRHFRASLFNYPIIATAGPATPTDALVDALLPSLRHLEYLDLGGPIASASILEHLPPSIQHLTLRGCSALTAEVVHAFVADLARRRKEFGSGVRRVLGSSRKEAGWEEVGNLRVLEVHGGATTGWKTPGTAWMVQKACWDAGVAWIGWSTGSRLV